MLKYFLFGIFCVQSIWISAQTDNDPIYVNYNFFPSRDFDKVDGSATYQQVEANVILPGFNLGKKTKVYTNLNYKVNSYDFEDTGTDVYPTTLNDFRLGFIVRHQVSDIFELILAPRINVRSDFEEKFSKRDLFPSAHLLGLRTHKQNPNLIYGLGVSYNNEGIKNLVIPIGILQYKNEDIRIYTIIPSFAYIMLTPSEKFEYGLSVNLEAGLFHIDRFSLDNSPNYLRTSNVTIAPTLGYKFYKDFWFNFRAGYAMPGNYQLLDADFEAVPYWKKNKLADSFSIMAGVSLRVKEKQD
ncbi:DUF6268 family outer membrane beta-barrel protein [Moheibacter lacus]|uniref:DUF6268 domain-containing protein n=1 Tax=Moheibacter lacus TaxID=2745851 RepID=A0A838ZP85_9FLAO|nr:DUF6268 family outer membrane beta-barrel protein [Moheibacter lacus]MBA5629860.1 hypothetical protein [Moheibacter lacus]